MTTGPSDAEISKQFWKSRFTRLKNEIEENNPSMVKPSAGAKAFQPIQDAAVAGASTRAFLTAFQGDSAPSGSQKVSPTEVANAKARIVESLVQQGKDAAAIEDMLNRVSPHLDIFAMTSDPAIQSVLLQRLVNSNSNQNFGLKDLIEATKLIHDVRNTPQQAQSDPASVMNAAGNLFRTGVETARGRNDGIDMNQVLVMQQESHDKMLLAQQEHFKELRELQQQQPTLVESLKQYRELQGLVGTSPDTPQVALRKLDLQAATDQREHESRLEAAKDKRQAELIRGITGGIGKALETPIIRELGKRAASVIPGAAPIVGAVTAASASATKQALEEPLLEMFSLDCAGCGTRYEFSRKQITLIQDGTGKWSCPKCGYTYEVGSQTDQKNDGPRGA